MRSGIQTILAVFSITFMVYGCSTPKATSVQSKVSSHKDGTIAFMKLVHVKGQNPETNIYKMFYWSDSQKVEAIVSEPKVKAHAKALFIYCHGGYNAPMPYDSHVTDASLGVPQPQDLSREPSALITIEPDYRGYAESQGAVGGLHDNAIDTENAIAAVESTTKVRTIYLVGGSMGGGVALMVASDPRYGSNIRAAEALSPFVGWNDVMQWAKENEQSNSMALTLEREGHNLNTQQNSPNVANIKAPVLLLQGTADHHVPWQTVEMLYKQMKQDGKTVQLDLFPGGNHGLTGKYLAQANKDEEAWFKKYR